MLFQPEIKITSTDNGFVLEWSKDMEDKYRSITSPPRKTRGVEVFTDRAKLLKRVRDLL